MESFTERLMCAPDHIFLSNLVQTTLSMVDVFPTRAATHKEDNKVTLMVDVFPTRAATHKRTIR